MKIGAMMFALLAAAAGSSAFAKGSYGHHAHHAGAAKAAAHRSVPASHHNPVADRAENNTGDKIDLGAPAMPLPSRDDGRTAMSPKRQIVKIDRAPTRRFGISVPPRPPVRNAIGQPAMPAVTVMQPETATSSQAGGSMSRQSGYGRGSIGNVKPIVRRSESASESISLTSLSRIDGSALIRPASAASLGGPAKPAGGINGTLLQQKHR